MLKKLNSTSLKEIIHFCKNNNIDIKTAKIETKIITDLSTCEDKVEIYLRYKK